ncbi:MAG: hypothetical protein JSR60_03035 [Proteobacteria bacterium]|nr:hypothetical protein [Pseudomonadota bacterium]
MAEALPAEIAAEFIVSDRKAYFEQRLFVLSPLGTWGTAAVIFALFMALYALAAGIDGFAFFGPTTRLAFVLTLLLTAILAVQRAVRMRQRADTPALARVLRGGLPQAISFGHLTPDAHQLWLATGIGILIGAAFDYVLYFRGMPMENLATRAWFSLITMLMVMTFTRGAELTRSGSDSTSAAIRDDLIVDLLRIDDLAVWGRNAARFAIIWFTISAFSCLLFVSSNITIFTIALLLGCLAIGTAVFFAMMERIHRRIRGDKRAELERVRGEIDGLKHKAVSDPAAAACLQGLLAYESRINAVQEWPFDQTTLLRLGASALILTVPWFGQAVAAYLVDHISRFAG